LLVLICSKHDLPGHAYCTRQQDRVHYELTATSRAPFKSRPRGPPRCGKLLAEESVYR
jgi:hypothetical protein